MKLKKRRKSSRYRGSQTAHRGAKERTRGSGNRGGKGMAGTGKRADHHKSYIYRYYGKEYWGKDKALRRGSVPLKLEVINLRDIQRTLASLVAQGKAKESGKGAYDITLKGYKILGDGDFSLKAHITASAASQSAIKKVKAAGGTLTIESAETEEKGENDKTEKAEMKDLNS